MVQNIIFDFDGVILDSMPIRELGFRSIFVDYEASLVEKLLAYHEANGGLSRYIKIAYFYEEILKESVSETEIKRLAGEFSEIMRQWLTDRKYLMMETVEFLKKNHKHYRLHIASGSDQDELRYLCTELGLADYFLSIFGSPTHKNDLVEMILSENCYRKEETILIGDSMNDYVAADTNGIAFYGYNNETLKRVSYRYLDDYRLLERV
jgi:HAD superfamily hydrolase (TIGR01549 family)